MARSAKISGADEALSCSGQGELNEYFARNLRNCITCHYHTELFSGFCPDFDAGGYCVLRTDERIEICMWRPESGRPSSHPRHTLADCKWHEEWRRPQVG